MKIKRYEVYNMKEALSLIKQDLGPEAVILTTRKIAKNSVFGLFSRPVLEVTAAVDYHSEKKEKQAKVPLSTASANRVNMNKTLSESHMDVDKFVEVLKSLGITKFEGVIEDIKEIKNQLNEMKSFISEKLVVDLSPPVSDFYSLLIRNGVDEIIAYKILKKLEKRIKDISSRLQVKEIIIQLLAEITPLDKNAYESIKQHVLVVMGPTGVGKTTTIAKLAATIAVKKQKRVGIISIDTFRIGAIEQLKTYADIIEVPFFIVTSPEQLREKLSQCSSFDYILVDTIGRSQYEKSQIREIKKYVEVIGMIKSAVVLSMSGNHAELYDTFDRYQNLNPDYVIFTKLDETKFFGPLINLPIVKKIPILFLTNGQSVPDDLEEPDGKKIAKYTLNDIPKVWNL
jgi:flagellar biosynthesis protein FlhF